MMADSKSSADDRAQLDLIRMRPSRRQVANTTAIVMYVMLRFASVSVMLCEGKRLIS